MKELFEASDAILACDTYPAFRKALVESGCARCPLHLRRTQIVADRGNPAASVLFIGEAPGENEDLQGRAFVGRSGKLLDGMLAELGFDTERDALIVNINKCRPPDNRRPSTEEIAACAPFLEKQLALVRPRIIALLGATALRGIFPGKKTSMSGQVGNFFTDASRPGVKFIVLYHPAYILRDPRKKPLMAEHLKFLVNEWKNSIQQGGSK